MKVEQIAGRLAHREADAAIAATDAAITPAPAPADSAPSPSRQPLRRALDRTIAASSLVSNDPVLDVRDFAWTARLREHWRLARDEALAAALHPVGPDQAAIAHPSKWRRFALWSHGRRTQAAAAHCPETADLVAEIPGLASAAFSILAPGAHIPRHRGATKGLITCHLGLIVPRDGDARMQLGDRVMRWAEGETLVFDDTCEHEVWNDTSGTRIVLHVQFRRPLRNPGRWLAERILANTRRRALRQGGTPVDAGPRRPDMQGHDRARPR